MKTADFEYSLPPSLIAEQPLPERSSSRLLVLHRDGSIEHRQFRNLPSYLHRGDILILNNTKVFPARLTGRSDDGRMLEMLLVREATPGTWEVLSKGSFTGRLTISDELQVDLDRGSRARFRCSGDLMAHLWKAGNMPLPPYIKRPPDRSDKENYQTVYASHEGSIAAPTAGLHFTRSLLSEIAAKGVRIREVTLHVGPGTFRPVRTEIIHDHSMEMEYFLIPKSLLQDIRETKAAGGRIVAVGTTTTRSIEGYFSGAYRSGSGAVADKVFDAPVTGHGPEREGSEWSGFITGTTDIFIRPGYAFQVVDSLITNFHLPRSTPLMLACALAGRDIILAAYEEAIASGYRFLSYGDAMLII